VVKCESLMNEKYLHKVLAVPAVIFALCMIFLLLFLDRTKSFYDFYSDNMRSSLFTGFLTIGGFLLTLKTFLLVKLKEGLYDTLDYRERIKSKQALNPKISLYGPLTRLGNFLIYCVLFALITAAFQLSIGFIQSDVTAAICVSAGFSTLGMVVWAWWEIKKNINSWFEMLEERERKNPPIL